jgi:hypothetical protein
MKSAHVACLVLGIGFLSTTAVSAGVVSEWNAITLNCVQGPPNPPNRGGPPGLLDIAVVQAAVHDAVQTIQGRYQYYHYENDKLRGTGSEDAAAAAAAYRTLVGLYGADDPCLTGVTDPAVTYASDPGLRAGTEAAAALLPLKRPSFALPVEPFLGGTNPGDWRPTPGVTQGANMFMGFTPPFALIRPAQFRPDRQYSLTSRQYLRDYNEVKAKGAAVNSTRTAAETDLARFWSVNFITQWYATVRALADAQVGDTGRQARLFALVAFAAADSQISIYDTKYVYNFWRPITAIQNGATDGNPRTDGDATWTPFIATPPYPDYTSGANCLVAAITTVLQQFFRTDRMPYAVSSSAAGVTTNPRLYQRFSQAQQELVEARVLQGIHFRFADEEGRRQGTRIALWTVNTVLKPVPPGHGRKHDNDHD